MADDPAADFAAFLNGHLNPEAPPAVVDAQPVSRLPAPNTAQGSSAAADPPPLDPATELAEMLGNLRGRVSDLIPGGMGAAETGQHVGWRSV